MIIVGILGMILFMFGDIADSFHIGENQETMEGFIKILSVVLGLFVYFASKALNISISDIIIEGMETSRPIAVKAVGLISPTILGLIVAWYIKRIFDQKQVIAKRVIFIFATFIIAMFGEVYLASFSTSNDLKLLPNVMFVVGVILYIVLGFTSDKNTTT